MSDLEPSPSVRQSLVNLRVGESYAKCERMELELLTKERIVSQTAAIRNTLCAAARRAKTDTGHDYAVETGNLLTANRDLIVVCVVTRRA